MQHFDKIPDLNFFLKKIITNAVANKASDIHITPMKNNVLIRYRMAWEVNSFCTITSFDYIKLINVIKITSWMDVSEFQNPQDWKYIIDINLDDKIISLNLRVSSLPSLYWENIVMRIAINSADPIKISELWFNDYHVKNLENIWELNNWLVLVAWETWSWKTSTLYSLLRTFDPFEKTIFTLEDPIEYIVDWFVQSEVKNKVEWKNESYSFQKWLMWLLRQDPDIILIWEIRDPKTASIALESANTWHIIFWSIHANDWVSVITRLIQLKIENYLIASWLKYIIFQRLTKKLCKECRIEKEINLKDYLKIESDKIMKVSFPNHDWCEKCNKWFKWLQLLWEVIEIDDTLSQMIFNNNSSVDIKKYLVSKKYISIFQDWLNKSVQWLVSFDDILSLK